MSIEDAYNSWAGQYDTNVNKTRDLDTKSTMETLERFEFSKVIELGCGTGKNTGFLLSKAEKIIALDVSQVMLAKAKTKFQDERIVFRKADITVEWDIDNDFANLITCSLVLEHIQDLNGIFKQAYQKMKPGGLFFISELHPFKQYSGSKARFNTDSGTVVLDTYVHHVSEYLETAFSHGFELVELKEWWDEDKASDIPRLIGILFRKGEKSSRL